MRYKFVALAVFLFFGLARAQFTNQPLHSPTRLEVNLSAIPIDQYNNTSNCITSPNCQTDVHYRFVGACAYSTPVRTCYQNALNAYFSQEIVTGVRFSFGMCGGYYSTPLVGCGGTPSFDPTGAWQGKLKEFFQDIYNSGIRNITPTPALQGFGGDAGYVHVNPAPDPCNVHMTDLEYWPTAPFPFQYAKGGMPYGWNWNNAYNCDTNGNTRNFVGWQNIYAAIGAVLQIAKTNSLCPTTPNCHLTVEEVDMYQEFRLDYATIFARFITDNTHLDINGKPENVLGNVRTLMTNKGYDPSRVNYSVLSPGSNSVQYNCGSVYGDYARVLPSSELAGAIGGGAIGQPISQSPPPPNPIPGPPTTNHLVCGGTAVSMIGLQRSYTEPTIIDVHSGPCLLDANGNCISYPTQTQNMAQLEATTTFSDYKTFLDTFCPTGWRHNSTQLCNALYMQGEVPVYQPQASPTENKDCDGSPISVPSGSVQGFNNSTLSGRRLPDGTAGVIFRPWVNPVGQHQPPPVPVISPPPGCYGSPQVLQPTFVPTP